MSEYSKPAITEIIAYLAAMGLVDVSGDRYPVLSLNKAAYVWLKGEEGLIIRRLVRLNETKNSPQRIAPCSQSRGQAM
jgi:hypothetical protein